MEASVLIPSGADRLHGMFYRPAGSAALGVLLCSPPFEERKGAQRVLVDAARALSDAGCAVLRFDYRGCGDSSGDLPGFTLEDWRADIAAASRFLGDQAGVGRIGRLGVRLGAALMLEAAVPGDRVAFSVLWAPVFNGRQYFDQELRRKLVKEMVTFGQSRVTRGALLKSLEEGRSVDLDGYEVTPALYRGISAIDLPALTHPVAGPRALLVQVAPATEPSREMLRLQEGLCNAGTAAEFIGVSEDPFWSLVGLVECPSLVSRTVQWIAEQK